LPFERDVFICHASPDKDDYVRPLVRALSDEHSLSCWVDELHVRPGDSLVRSIATGVASSRFVAVLITRQFLDRRSGWTEAELNAAFQREMSTRQTVVVPVLAVPEQEWFEHYPLLADKLYIPWDLGPEGVAQRIATLFDDDGRLVEEAPTPGPGPELAGGLQLPTLMMPGQTDPNVLKTILGPDGRPLEPSQPAFAQVEASVQKTSDDLIAQLAKEPELMYELDPRQFEELIAELYHRQGFEVHLTHPSADSGVDMYAVQKAPFGSFLTAVECKRYGKDHLVGVSLVRQLLGTIMETNASTGVVATTSRFTRDARAFQEQQSHRIALQDFLSISDMLKRVAQEE
jgi:hypothetical protein